ncbi:hypothetical protein [Streptomyces sp. NBC_01483]|uniref:hypothetical protein n=1 Tax=Streptomyces sp. NBC_01483 TaxID=2903883 RepID=UPI002E321E28|nr:hypothetical protein [Streptomyces sp. NBC_01483]
MEEDQPKPAADGEAQFGSVWSAPEHPWNGASELAFGEDVPHLLVITSPCGQGKTQAALEAAKWLMGSKRGVHGVTLLHTPVALLDFGVTCTWGDGDDARARLRGAVENLRSAASATERRTAARDFLAALAELIACLLRFLMRVLILLLSRLLDRAATDDAPVWKPEPIDTSPQITPRGPNSAFPVTIHRGGHHSSALGSAVLAT